LDVRVHWRGKKSTKYVRRAAFVSRSAVFMSSVPSRALGLDQGAAAGRVKDGEGTESYKDVKPN
jgi:hypothetical protein